MPIGRSITMSALPPKADMAKSLREKKTASRRLCENAFKSLSVRTSSLARAFATLCAQRHSAMSALRQKRTWQNRSVKQKDRLAAVSPKSDQVF